MTFLPHLWCLQYLWERWGGAFEDSGLFRCKRGPWANTGYIACLASCQHVKSLRLSCWDLDLPPLYDRSHRISWLVVHKMKILVSWLWQRIMCQSLDQRNWTQRLASWGFRVLILTPAMTAMTAYIGGPLHGYMVPRNDWYTFEGHHFVGLTCTLRCHFHHGSWAVVSRAPSQCIWVSYQSSN